MFNLLERNDHISKNLQNTHNKHKKMKIKKTPWVKKIEKKCLGILLSNIS